jgi:hypothetical protein
MQFIFFVCSDKTAEKYDPAGDNIDQWVDEFDSSGARKMGDAFDNPATFRTVKIRDGAPVVSEGPFQTTDEAILGFDVIECKDMDEAITIAAKHPMAKYGQIEIRPFAIFD